MTQRLYEVIGGWFLSKDSEQERAEALSEYFDKNFEFSRNPSRQAYKSFAVFLQKAGVKKRPLTITLLYRRVAFRYAAAVLALIIIISGGVYLLVERVEDTVGPTRIAIITTPANPAISQTSPVSGTGAAAVENKTYTLPDNSTVSLSEGSTISYGEAFAEGRHVELRGEAHFNVRKAETAADHFTVHTEYFDITVLGTQFGVHSHAGETFSTIDLYHGSVEVSAGGKSVAMKPTDHLRYDHITKETTLTTIPYTELRYDEMPGLVFEDALLTEVLKKVESEYNIRFRIEGEIPADQMRIRGTLTHLQSLSGLMKTFQMMSGRFDYEITDNEIKIYNIR